MRRSISSFRYFAVASVSAGVNMADSEVVDYVIPTLRVPVKFRFHDIDVDRVAVLDTVIVEPHCSAHHAGVAAGVPLRKSCSRSRRFSLVSRRRRRQVSPLTTATASRSSLACPMPSLD